MRKFKRILAVVDPTAMVQPAVHRAAWLAGRTGATLELLVSYYDEYLSGNRLFDADSLRYARQEVLSGLVEFLHELARPLREQGISVTTMVLWHHPLHDAIVRQAESIGADIVVKDAHHHSALERALFTHSDWALIRTCPTPLWLVKALDFPAEPVFVAAVDPFHEDDKSAALDDEILDIGSAVAKAGGVRLHAFNAYDPRTALATATANAYVPASLPLNEIERETRAQHEKRLGEIAEFHGISRENCHLAAGPAHEELPLIARKLGASLVVTGAVTRSRLKRLFIGSTAERTLEHLPCDLLIVKPGWIRMASEDDRQDAA